MSNIAAFATVLTRLGTVIAPETWLAPCTIPVSTITGQTVFKQARLMTAGPEVTISAVVTISRGEGADPVTVFMAFHLTVRPPGPSRTFEALTILCVTLCGTVSGALVFTVSPPKSKFAFPTVSVCQRTLAAMFRTFTFAVRTPFPFMTVITGAR